MRNLSLSRGHHVRPVPQKHAFALNCVVGSAQLFELQVLGWIRSWSGYATWRAAKVPGPDPLLQFHGDLKDALEFDSHSDTVELEYEFYLMLARRTRGGTGQA